MSKIVWANKVENNGATAAGKLSAADANAIKDSVNALYDELPYKSYVALITQSATDAPTLEVLQNTTGLTFVATRQALGSYRLTPSAAFVTAKTLAIVGQNQEPINKTLVKSSTSSSAYLRIETVDLVTQALIDERLYNTPIEIRIYP